ncbi:nucleoside-diphosphate sugar epimerase [Paenibacillus sp. FSL R10-2782]|uniref:Nucleoside-diphosphate sugar epimerase n=1 Tax=Paenibacillus terrae TaxID=159743 RepID=A0A4U2Q8U8_9BACL|nr:nucleoside-diphosphate sugar epimerase [Paenibacillus terrae]TKH46734.1 nucleoside-diphosphate sugar epimerase [Paenibacillus terrae]
MHNEIDDLLIHISHSQQQMSRLLDAERQVVVRMSQIIHELPDEEPRFDGIPGILDSSGQVNKSIVAYLNGIADLQEAMAEMLVRVVKETAYPDEE